MYRDETDWLFEVAPAVVREKRKRLHEGFRAASYLIRQGCLIITETLSGGAVMNNTVILSSDACLGHFPGPEHPECPDRLIAVRDALSRSPGVMRRWGQKNSFCLYILPSM